MRLFKSDFFRFFGIGFAVGAALVFVAFDGNAGSDLAAGVVPVAEAAPAH